MAHRGRPTPLSTIPSFQNVQTPQSQPLTPCSLHRSDSSAWSLCSISHGALSRGCGGPSPRSPRAPVLAASFDSSSLSPPSSPDDEDDSPRFSHIKECESNLPASMRSARFAWSLCFRVSLRNSSRRLKMQREQGRLVDEPERDFLVRIMRLMRCLHTTTLLCATYSYVRFSLWIARVNAKNRLGCSASSILTQGRFSEGSLLRASCCQKPNTE